MGFSSFSKDVVHRVSKDPTSIRLIGETFTATNNASTTLWVPLGTDRQIRGASVQCINGKAGDWIETWVSDRTGTFGPNPTRITNYIPKFCVFEHGTGDSAPIFNIVDPDASDTVPGFLDLEIVYHAIDSGTDRQIVLNFWTYILV